MAEKNVAWMIARHHNIGQAARIILDESKLLEEAGLEGPAQDLLLLSGKVQGVVLRLECFKVNLEEDE